MREFDFTKTPGIARLERNLVNEGSPLVSFITPFYNAGQFFMETANCVLNQTFPYFEWIIVNDGSTKENDLEILAQVEQLDSRIVVYHKVNGGPAAARNYGILQSQTEIIIPLDADDLIEPTFCECIYWSLYTNPDASWSYTNSVGFFEQEYLWKKPFITNQMKTENLLVCTAGIRKKDMIESGLYTESEDYYDEDWLLWLKLLASRKYPVHMDWYGFWYRRTTGGVRGYLSSNKEAQKRSHQIIDKTAKQVDKKLRAVEYPRFKLAANFPKPYKWEWNRNSILGENKTKVLLLLPHMEMGGADLFNLDVVSRINKNEFEMSIITTNPTDSTWRQRFEEQVVDLFDLTTFLDIDQWSAFIHYFIQSRSIDILFVSNSYFGYYLVPWLRKEFPKLIIIDYVHMEEWYWRAGGYARTSGAAGDILEKTYVCNEHLRQVLIESFGKQPNDVETLYIGVDEDEFNPDLIESGQIRKSLKIEEERPIVLFPCRVHPQKRPFMMLKIAKALRDRIPKVAFVVVGDGPQLEELQEMIRKEGLERTVYCVGRQRDVRAYYRDSAVTLICSLKEGLSLTSYESLSMGVPVVSSDVGGQKELINDEVGRILPLYQDETNDLDNRNFAEEELEQYVLSLYYFLNLTKEEQIKLHIACRQRIQQGFSKKQMIERLESELRSWKAGRGQEKRLAVSTAIELFPNLVEDYMALYSEFEVYSIHSNRAVLLLEYIKAIINFEKSPIAILKDFRRMSNRYFMQQIIARFKATALGRIFRKVRMAIR